MKQYICEFMTEYDYPQPASDAVFEAYDALEKNENFHTLLNCYYKDENINVDKEEGPLYPISQSENVHFYTAKLVFYICLSRDLKREYLKAGYTEAFWSENIADLHCKMMECFNVHHIWGIFSLGWFNHVFRMRTFTLGRMCYNVGEYDGENFAVASRTVKRGDKFISIHIPSSGKPFDRAARLDSYERAYYFFKEDFGEKEPLFRCESWLLYPANRKILSSGSNIVSFADDFKLVKSYEYPDNRYMWRIFGDKYELPPEELPRDSSLRRAYADFLAKGNKPGAGVGFFLYDPINRTTLR